DVANFDGYDGWQVRQGFSVTGFATVRLMGPMMVDGVGNRVRQLRVDGYVSPYGAPERDREIFHAQSADGRVVLTTTMTGGRIDFSVESTALEALALSRKSSGDFTLGISPGDDPVSDNRVGAVASAIQARMAEQGSSGINGDGFPDLGTEVFAAVD